MSQIACAPYIKGMKLSVLDQSPGRQGMAQDVSIRETLELAKHCEALGYSRYWVSEHHNTDSVTGSAPEILMAAIAATTSRIRVGSAGIMLPHYSALKVAEQFRVLEAIAPGRIDLGVGRAPGGDGRTAFALNPNAANAADLFPAQLRDLQAWSSGTALPENHPFRTIRAVPEGPYAPEIWMLGSSNYGAQVAAYFGLPYCFAYFFSDGRGAREALEIYRETYRPNPLNPKPHSAITVAAFVAETQAEADANYLCWAVTKTMRDRGQYIAMPSPQAAAEFEMTPAEQARSAQLRSTALYGLPGEVSAKIRALAQALQVDEIAITTFAYDPAARRNSYSLLAREFALGAAPATAEHAHLEFVSST
jgi:luciferase family oxidoreductase group 1